MGRPARTLGCTLHYQVGQPGAGGDAAAGGDAGAGGTATFLFAVQPSDHPAARQQVLREELSFSTGQQPEAWRGPDGTRWLRLLAAPGPLTLRYEAEVQGDPLVHDPAAVSEIPVERLPQAALPFLLPSRYCENDRLEGFAAAEFGRLPPGHARVTAVCDFIHRRTAYQRGATDVRTTALDTLTDARGVCRDFAHLGIALTRAIGVPARFLAAYAPHLVPPDFHAIFEALLLGPDGPRWYVFDATRQTALDGVARIAVGQDASQVAFASIWGAATPGPMQLRCDPEPGAPAEWTTAAVSVSDS
ncbi:transglutaminase-like domain-containing protein [Roseomonas sp. BN140053]|uniref:transglutaminase-like domain-containing protein n=1 Tax=Roseomonas sp. BN140053 TaxID=3391898 RepID=UPI0039E7E4C9